MIRVLGGEHAEEDFILARAALRRKQPLTSGVCFHAQQCAEKYMKALLIYKDHEFPKVHDLSILDEICSSAGIFIGISGDRFEFLSGYAVGSRYPGDEPTLEETKEAIKIAKSIRRFSRSFLGVKK